MIHLMMDIWAAALTIAGKSVINVYLYTSHCRNTRFHSFLARSGMSGICLTFYTKFQLLPKATLSSYIPSNSV